MAMRLKQHTMADVDRLRLIAEEMTTTYAETVAVREQNRQIRAENAQRLTAGQKLLPACRLRPEITRRVESERAKLRKLKNRTPEAWLACILELPAALQGKLACLVWWDFFGPRRGGEPWPHLDALMEEYVAADGEEPAEDEQFLALINLGYTPLRALGRCRGAHSGESTPADAVLEYQESRPQPLQSAPAAPQREDVLPQTNKEREVETKKQDNKKNGTGVCWLCGEDRKLKSHLGQDVCASCTYIMTTAKSRPAALSKALEEFGPLPSAPLKPELMALKGKRVVYDADMVETTATPADDLLERVQLLEETTNARIDTLERIAVQIGSLAGLAGLVTSEAKKINSRTAQFLQV